jgi:hypothetical protein
LIFPPHFQPSIDPQIPEVAILHLGLQAEADLSGSFVPCSEALSLGLLVNQVDESEFAAHYRYDDLKEYSRRG